MRTNGLVPEKRGGNGGSLGGGVPLPSPKGEPLPAEQTNTQTPRRVTVSVVDRFRAPSHRYAAAVNPSQRLASAPSGLATKGSSHFSRI